MNYEVTTNTGSRTIEINWPANFKKVGIFVSGGLDSALLLWMYAQLTPPADCELIPLHATRGDPVCEQSARNIVEKVNKLFNLNLQFMLVNIETDVEVKEKQVPSAVTRAFTQLQQKNIVEYVICGDTANPPDELPGWGMSQRQPIENQHKFPRWGLPVLHIDKSHTIKLLKDLNLDWAFELTRSCVNPGVPHCGLCWTCNERAWGFAQNNLIDTGLL